MGTGWVTYWAVAWAERCLSRRAERGDVDRCGIAGRPARKGIDGVDLDEAVSLVESVRDGVRLVVGGAIEGLDLDQLDTLTCQLGDQLIEQRRADALTALGVSDRDPEDLRGPVERRSTTANPTTRSVSRATQPEWTPRSLSTFAGTSSVK